MYNKSSLAAFFETGDVPTGTDYMNLVDSCLNLVETSAQSMAGALIVTELITPRVSATNMNITGTYNAVNASYSGTVSAGIMAADSFSKGTFTSIVSAPGIASPSIVGVSASFLEKVNAASVSAASIIAATATFSSMVSAQNISVASDTNSNQVNVMASGGLTFANQTTGGAAAVGTLTNAPSAGNPNFWIPIRINGVQRFVPAW